MILSTFYTGKPQQEAVLRQTQTTRTEPVYGRREEEEQVSYGDEKLWVAEKIIKLEKRKDINWG